MTTPHARADSTSERRENAVGLVAVALLLLVAVLALGLGPVLL